jgi:hypothetical protein
MTSHRARRNGISPQSALAACFAAGLGLGLAAAPGPRHPGLSADDRFRLCAGEVLGKPVMSDRLGRKILAVPCPAPRAELVRDLERAGKRVLDTGRWIYLAPQRFIYPEATISGPPQWERLSIVPSVVARGAEWIPGTRELTEAETQEASERIFQESRSVPLRITHELNQDPPGMGLPSPDGKTAVQQIYLKLNAVRLGRGETESVVGVRVHGRQEDVHAQHPRSQRPRADAPG